MLQALSVLRLKLNSRYATTEGGTQGRMGARERVRVCGGLCLVARVRFEVGLHV